MQELKRLTLIFIFGVAGVVISLGGSIYTAVRMKNEREEATLPVQAIPVPATLNGSP